MCTAINFFLLPHLIEVKKKTVIKKFSKTLTRRKKVFFYFPHILLAISTNSETFFLKKQAITEGRTLRLKIHKLESQLTIKN
jgi:hypothetical protein